VSRVLTILARLSLTFGQETEFITAAMFKTFLDSHNRQMDTIQHSLDSLNYTYYDEYEDYEDEEGDISEQSIDHLS
jgi:hypothetical protein